MRIRKPKLHKRALLTLGIVLVLVLGIILPVGMIYADSLDEMIPGDNNDTAIYNKYGVSHYSFQTVTKDRHFWQVAAKAQDGIVRAYDHMLSMLFLATVQITRFFNYVAREAFTFEFMNDLIDAVEGIIQNITGVSGGTITSGGFWDSLGGMLVVITIAYILWLMVRARFLDGMQQAASFVIALFICLAFFSQAGTFLKFVNDMGNSTGNIIYVGLAKATGLNTNSQDGVTVISEQVWNELVIRPYTMLQFDDPAIATDNPTTLDKVLKTEPFSDEREAALKEASSNYPAVSKERSDEQMIIIICNLIFAIFILGLFCFWAVATIFMRIKLLIHAATMSITLLAALFPGREAGLSVVRSQFVKLIGLAVTTVFTMFFLDLSLVMGHLAFDVVAVKAGKGWFTGMVIEAIVVFVVFKYRKEIGSVFSKAAGVIPAMPKAKSTIVDSIQRNATRSLYTGAANKVSGLFNRREPEGVPTTFNPGSLSRADTSLNDATNSSMMLRYQREKQAAEDISAETGQPAQYTPFVQKVNENMRSGTKNPFRGMDKEWKEEKGRLKDIQNDGGSVKQAILTSGVHEGMNDQEVAATMYGNENAIRQAASFMVDRPKRAVDQIERAKTLNKNRKLQTAVNDFCMIQLFDRYKVEYKRAVDTANVTGEPVKHTDFVKNMEGRFKDSGLNTNKKVNDTMLTRSGRVSIASKFEGMKEFNDYKMKLLKANEAFRKAAPPSEGVVLPGLQVRMKAPASKESIMSKVPKLPDGRVSRQSYKQDATVLLNTKPAIDTNMNVKKLNFSNPELKAKMDAASANLGKTMNADDLRLEIDTVTKQQVVVDLKQKISTEVSGGLQDELNHLKTMQRSRQVATVSKSTESISQNVQSKAQTARKNKAQKNTSV